MICPKCGNEMIQGFIFAPGFNSITKWGEYTEKFSVRSFPVTKPDLFGMGTNKIDAWRCTTCKTITFEYTEPKEVKGIKQFFTPR